MSSVFEALGGGVDYAPDRYKRRKLSAEDVAEIRFRYSEPGRPVQKELAEEYGVTQGQISKVVNGLHWKEQ